MGVFFFDQIKCLCHNVLGYYRGESREILIVSGRFHNVQKVIDVFEGHEVRECYREYYVADYIEHFRPDIILSDGSCKTREPDNDEPIGVYYSPFDEAKKYNIPVYPLWLGALLFRLSSLFSRTKPA